MRRDINQINKWKVMPLVIARKKSYIAICELVIVEFALFREGDFDLMFEGTSTM